ncbi:MAG TPA: PilX N-terminal domain-containing pilus assembly protein, partial [Burkholderiaceae bacterium]|nr:PilX N-terminal domain-containing pilus assembly protein [Burkholderiaceae bacterium]
MKLHRQRGATLAVGLLLLTVVTLLGLAGAHGAHIERQLARNEQFRENAASAASAGIEFAISQMSASDTLPHHHSALLPGTSDGFEYDVRLIGYELGLPQA